MKKTEAAYLEAFEDMRAALDLANDSLRRIEFLMEIKEEERYLNPKNEIRK
jgi:hypothetical protein